MNQLKCHVLQIQLNNRFLHMLQQSIQVSLIAVSVEQLTRSLPLVLQVLTLANSADNRLETS